MLGESTLTHSRMACFKSCPKKHNLAYNLGIRRHRDQAYFRMGGNFHEGLDLRAQGVPMPEVVEAIRQNYANVTPWFSDDDSNEWCLECEKVCRLLYGYDWRWGDDGIEVIATEQTFTLPIRNPETGSPSTVFNVSGKIDKIVKLADGRLAVMEHKTTGDPIESPEADYWKRCRIDHQVTQYFWAAQQLGHDVQTIIYDVTHKPTIRPKLIKGVRETIEQYGDRLTQNIGERPGFYFQRQEVPRLQSDVDEFLVELWQQQKAIRQSQLNGWHFRNTSACAMFGRCEYLDICHGAGDFTDGIPAGFVQLENIHPELEIAHDDIESPA